MFSNMDCNCQCIRWTDIGLHTSSHFRICELCIWYTIGWLAPFMVSFLIMFIQCGCFGRSQYKKKREEEQHKRMKDVQETDGILSNRVIPPIGAYIWLQCLVPLHCGHHWDRSWIGRCTRVWYNNIVVQCTCL